MGLPLFTRILVILDIYAGWGYWGCLWGFLGLLLITGNPGDMEQFLTRKERTLLN
jgi:hypothetical protein